MAVLNRVKVNVSTVGTGTVALGPVFAGFQSFDAAGGQDGARYSYTIEDGAAFELGFGVWDKAAGTLTRELAQSSTGELLNLSGSAILFVTALQPDLPGRERLAAEDRKARRAWLFRQAGMEDPLSLLDEFRKTWP